MSDASVNERLIMQIIITWTVEFQVSLKTVQNSVFKICLKTDPAVSVLKLITLNLNLTL